MAFEQDKGAGNLTKLIAWLEVPRGFTLFALFALGLGLAQLLWIYVDSVKVLAWLSGLTAPFCMLCATAVWAMRDKADLAFLNESITAEEYLKASSLERTLRRRSTYLAARTCIAALFAAMPAISNQLIGPVWQAMVLAGGGAVGFAVHAYLVADHWDHQLRAHRSQDIYIRKRAEERQALINDIERGAFSGSSSANFPPSWIDGPVLRTPGQDH